MCYCNLTILFIGQVNLDQVGLAGVVEVVAREAHRASDGTTKRWLYALSVEVKNGSGPYSGKTKIITFRPRYRVANQTGYPARIRQFDTWHGKR